MAGGVEEVRTRSGWSWIARDASSVARWRQDTLAWSAVAVSTVSVPWVCSARTEEHTGSSLVSSALVESVEEEGLLSSDSYSKAAVSEGSEEFASSDSSA
ncbi:hypothetical protein MTO96_051881 [Rhipicephalus appendiculatus]